jgi:hypothetical protein
VLSEPTPPAPPAPDTVPLFTREIVDPGGHPPGIVSAEVDELGAPMITPALIVIVRLTTEVPFQIGEA